MINEDNISLICLVISSKEDWIIENSRLTLICIYQSLINVALVLEKHRLFLLSGGALASRECMSMILVVNRLLNQGTSHLFR